jgi:hypothetical protein
LLKFVIFLLALAFQVVFSSASKAQSTPTMTQAQVLQVASTFCQAIGQPVTGTATATYPAPLRYAGMQATNYQSRWLVTYDSPSGEQAELEIVDATGAVSRYYNFALSQQDAANTAPAGTSLPQTTALQDAAADLQAAGLPIDAGTPTATNIQIMAPALSSGNLWQVIRPRQYQGVPYRNQQVSVMLQAETGAILGLSVAFPSPPPAVGAGPITQNQAEATAEALLTVANIPSLTLQSCQQLVVQPNTFWQQNGSVTPQPNVAGQVAWDCLYTDSNGNNDEVWVDTNSGNVIGGESYGLAHGGRAKTGKALSAAKRPKVKAVRREE